MATQEQIDALEDTLTIVLIKPIDDVFEIMLTEPTAGEMEALGLNAKKHGELKAMQTFIAGNAKVDPTIVPKLRARDFQKAQRFLAGFLEEPTATV